MSARPPFRSLVAAALLLLAPRVGSALCTANQIIAADPSCPAGTGLCTISGTYTIDDGCTLDFGSRVVSLSGRLNIANVATGTSEERKHVGTMTLRAGALSLAPSGLIDGIGQGQDEVGGVVIIEVPGAFAAAKSSRIEVSGNRIAGAIIIRAGTTMVIAGRLFADYENIGAAGGVVDLTSRGDMTLTVDSSVSARGGYDSDGGGEIDLTAGGNLAVQSVLRVDASDGGFVEVRAEGTVTFAGADASGGGDAGSGGCIDVTAGSGTTITGPIVANGATGTFMTGGCGGLVCLDGGSGTMTIASTGSVAANGASPDGGGGQVSLLGMGSAVVNGALAARGPTGETCGGDICVDVGLDATISGTGTLDASGGDAGGTIEFIVGRNISIDGRIDLNGRQQAALGGDVALRAGNRGSGNLRLNNAIDVSSAPSCSDENGCGQGGTTDLFGCDVTLTPSAALLATGPDAGQQSLTAREQLRVQGLIDTRRTVAAGSNGVNRIQYSQRKAPNLLGSTILPTAETQGFTTCPTDGPTLPTCLEPCPTCGNGQVEYPETCDLGAMPPTSCNGCSLFCQLEDCVDDLVCTGDECLPAVGCRHKVTPACTEPPTPTPTITGTLPTATSTPTPSATRTATGTPTATQTPVATATVTATVTPTASASATATATNPPTATLTATNPPTATPTLTATPVDTPTPSQTATVPPTATPTITATSAPTTTDTSAPSPTATATATASASPTPPTAACPGDCNGNGEVAVNELITGVNIALGNSTVDACPSFDRNGDGSVSINELIAAVNAALNGC